MNKIRYVGFLLMAAVGFGAVEKADCSERPIDQKEGSGLVLGVVSFSGPGTYDEAVIRFAQNARKEEVEEIEELNLYGANISDGVLEHLVGLPIRALNLSITDVSDKGLEHVAKISTLERLELAGTNVSDAGMKKLRALKALKHLDVFITEISDIGMEEITKMEALVSLQVGDTRVSDKGLKEIGRLKLLEEIYVGRGDWGVKQLIGDEGLRSLAELDNLKKLEMPYLRTTVETVSILAGMPALKYLSLPELPGAGYQGLKELVGLETVIFNRCELDPRLAELKKLKFLKNIEFFESNLADGAAIELRKALPDCKIGDPRMGHIERDSG